MVKARRVGFRKSLQWPRWDMGGPKPCKKSGDGEQTSQLSLKKVCDLLWKFTFSQIYGKKTTPMQIFQRRPYMWNVRRKATLGSIHCDFQAWPPHRLCQKSTDNQRSFSITSLLHSPEQLKRENILSTFLWLSQSRVSGELSRNKSPKSSLCCVNPKSVVWGIPTRKAISGLVGTAQKFWL